MTQSRTILQIWKIENNIENLKIDKKSTDKEERSRKWRKLLNQPNSEQAEFSGKSSEIFEKCENSEKKSNETEIDKQSEKINSKIHK